MSERKTVRDAREYGIDAHKLHLHPRRVAQWLDGEDIFPLYMEFSPSGACNHRCVFCTMDFMGYRPRFLDTANTCARLRECGSLGVRAVMFGGEGEPLLHKDIALMAEAASEAGIDVAFTTNAVLLTPEKASRLLPVSSWIKVSCNAGDAATYAATHRTTPDDFETVLHNMEAAAALRARQGLDCALGLQCLLLPENAGAMPNLARRAREIGLDYLVVKPYTHHPQSCANNYGDIKYNDFGQLAAQLQEVETGTFKVIFREAAMRRWDEKALSFDRCLALPFWAYVDAGGNVWGCSRHLREEHFHYGNLNETTFRDIWQGEKRRENLRWCAEHLDIKQCHVTCRMEMINQYLWRLRHPAAHDNFI